MLSAQSTDRQVNRITGKLFADYPGPEQIAALPVDELAQLIRGCGLYQVKSRHLSETCRILVNKYGGEVPRRVEELVKLPGVGRKTALVVVSNAFGEPALAVDTHVFRVAHRLGLATGPTVEKTEAELCACIPKELWSQAHHWLIHHGREICRARAPRCAVCPLRGMCPSAEDNNGR